MSLNGIISKDVQHLFATLGLHINQFGGPRSTARTPASSSSARLSKWLVGRRGCLRSTCESEVAKMFEVWLCIYNIDIILYIYIILSTYCDYVQPLIMNIWCIPNIYIYNNMIHIYIYNMIYIYNII